MFSQGIRRRQDDPKRLRGPVKDQRVQGVQPTEGAFLRKWRKLSSSERDTLSPAPKSRKSRERERGKYSQGGNAADRNGMEVLCGNPATPWVKQHRHPLPLLRAHSRQNQLSVPSNILLHPPPKTLQQNAPSTITPPPPAPVPVLPRHHFRQVPLLIPPAPQNVLSTMERPEI